MRLQKMPGTRDVWLEPTMVLGVWESGKGRICVMFKYPQAGTGHQVREFDVESAATATEWVKALGLDVNTARF